MSIFDPETGADGDPADRQRALIRELRRCAQELLDAEQATRSSPTLDNIGRLVRARRRMTNAIVAAD